MAAGAHPRVKFAILRGLKDPDPFSDSLSHLLADSSALSHRFSDHLAVVVQMEPDNG
jgi:hypothetical protein